jgi:hypothetical protein
MRPFAELEILDVAGALGARPARDMHQGVDVAKARHGAIDRLRHLLLVHHVGPATIQPARFSAEFREHRVERLFIGIDDENRQAHVQQSPDDRLADSPGAARHDRRTRFHHAVRHPVFLYRLKPRDRQA